MKKDPQKRDYSQLMKDALREITQLRSELAELRSARSEPIAIVGMSCRLPGGVESLADYWRLLHNGEDAIIEVPADRWNQNDFYDADPDAPGKISTNCGGFLQSRIDSFDSSFFGISPREARSLDPQQRLLLEVSWEALETAGQSPAKLFGSKTGVFMGMSTFDYALHQVGGDIDENRLARLDGYVGTGSALSPAAGRLSYFLGLTGPSMVVDTACSSSLVAAHLAVESLRRRECELALVGGVNLLLRPEWNVNFTKAHMLAPDGRCKTFDASANGYSRGEGCGVIVMKRLSDAVRSRDRIYAQIRGSAVNQDGASGGLTVPRGPAQEAVIRDALREAKVHPQQVSYIEAHGTGTSLGDPIEMGALAAVFGPGRADSDPLYVGSVKTNIGHLEAAAGIGGLIKLALSLHHQELPAHLHFNTPNPLIDWDAIPIKVPTKATPWRSEGKPRIAGISSFGFAGTNAHLVLEESPPSEHDEKSTSLETPPTHRPLHLLTLSAQSKKALGDLVALHVDHLRHHPNLPIDDVAFTTNTGRSHFPFRIAVTSDTTDMASQRLADWLSGAKPKQVFDGFSSQRPKIAFLFAGQGTQHIGMGRQLYENQSNFRATIDRCDEILQPYLDCRLLDVLYGPSRQFKLIDQTAYTQPALFAIDYALAELWREWGVVPDAVLGHSVGELVAACVAGVFSLEDALALVAERGRLMQTLPHSGEMHVVFAGEDQVANAIASHRKVVSIAAINGPNNVVISGQPRALSEIVNELRSQQIQVKQLTVSHAFHSPLMEPILPDFASAASKVSFSKPQITLVSNLTGRRVIDEITSPDYWVRHIREPVNFAAGMGTLAQDGYRMFVENGPTSTLLSMGRQCIPDSEQCEWLPSLRPEMDWQQLLGSVAQLYAKGVNINWDAFWTGQSCSKVPLPTYPFQRKRHWFSTGQINGSDIEAKPSTKLTIGPTAPSGKSPELDSALPADLLYQVQWRKAPQSQSLFPAKGHWIILADKSRLASLLAKMLKQNGAKCSLVSQGEAFRRLGDGRYELAPSDPTGMSQLCKAVIDQGDPIGGVVHQWSLDAPSTSEISGTNLFCQPAIESCVDLAKSLLTTSGVTKAPIWLVTRNAVSIGDDKDSQPLSLMQTPTWGLARVIAIEQPELWGGIVDLAPTPELETPEFEADAESILRELLGRTGEDQVAIRDGDRYVPRLAHLQAPSLNTPMRLNPDGMYLVAGGLGGLGLHVSRWLVSNGARYLTITSRRGTKSPGAQAAIRELESLGATKVVVAGADIARESDVKGLLEGIANGGPRLCGVFHCAGIDAQVPLADMSHEDIRTMLASKVAGGWLLHEKTADANLELFVCFSSISSIWGSVGRAHYAASNAFLDGLAHERRRLGLPALSINWGPWSGGGMASDSDLRELAQLGVHGLDPNRALNAMELLFRGHGPQATVADVDWPTFRSVYEARLPRPLLSEMQGKAAVAPEQTAETDTDWVALLRKIDPQRREDALRHQLRQEVAQVLGFGDPEEVSLDRSVFEMGMDSLMAVQLAMRMQRRFGLESSRLFFEHSNIGALSTSILEEISLPIEGDDVPDDSNDGAQISSEAPAIVPNGTFDSQPTTGLVSYHSNFDHGIFEFIEKAWPRRRKDWIQPRWQWMFIESAKRLGVPPMVWLYLDEGSVVGHHGAIPVRLQIGKDELTSGWFADTMTLESHRKLAIGAQLMMRARVDLPFGLSLGQTKEIREMAHGLGWKTIAPLQTFVLPIRPRQVLRTKLNPVFAEIVGGGMNAREFVRRSSRKLADTSLSICRLDHFDASHERLWDSVRNDYECAVMRDAAYLNWKYVDQPGQSFVRFELLRDNEVVAIAVLKIMEATKVYRYRRAFIVELIVSPTEADLVMAVLESIRREALALQADSLVFHLINKRLEQHVKRFGFIQREATRYLMACIDSLPAETRQKLLAIDNWLITMGDSDIDRPW